MEIIKGNLIDLAVSGKAGIIVHGCNCFHAMGSGIAGALAHRFPEIPHVDIKTTTKGDPSKLGSYSEVTVTKESYDDGKVPRSYSVRDLPNSFRCINLYTQFTPGADFIESVFVYAIKQLNKDFAGETLWFPKIGCGIGGGNWERVESLMLEHLTDVNVKVVVL
jgi:O-acetyl-ADP-ribose deacetylase (regulator of RNase III)